MLQNSMNVMVRPEFSPVNCPLLPHPHPQPPPPPSFHLIVYVECRLINLKII